MGYSKIYLGLPLERERALQGALGCDLDRLHVLGQRVAWGILMGARVGVDLDKEAARLRAELADQPAAQVALAFVCSSGCAPARWCVSTRSTWTRSRQRCVRWAM